LLNIIELNDEYLSEMTYDEMAGGGQNVFSTNNDNARRYQF
jgi:hypothetical protein